MAGTAEERAVFEKVMPKTASAPAPVSAAPMAQPEARMVKPEELWRDGQVFKDKKAAKVADAAKPAAPEAEPERALDGKFTTPEKKQEAFDDAKYELARNALSRSGWKKKELDAMEPEDLVKRGLQRAKALEKDDEAHRFAKEAKESRATTPATGKTEQVSKPAEFKLPDTSKLLEPLAKSLALDEEGAKALRGAFEEFASMYSQTAVAPLQQKLAEFEQMHVQSTARTEQELVNSAREEVGKRFPDLLDPDTFEKVAENVRVLGNLPKYQEIASLPGRVNACFEDACKLLGLQPAESDSQVRVDAKAQRRASGSTVGDRARPTPTTQKERDRERFDELMAKHGLD